MIENFLGTVLFAMTAPWALEVLDIDSYGIPIFIYVIIYPFFAKMTLVLMRHRVVVRGLTEGCLDLVFKHFPAYRLFGIAMSDKWFSAGDPLEFMVPEVLAPGTTQAGIVKPQQ